VPDTEEIDGDTYVSPRYLAGSTCDADPALEPLLALGFDLHHDNLAIMWNRGCQELFSDIEVLRRGRGQPRSPLGSGPNRDKQPYPARPAARRGEGLDGSPAADAAATSETHHGNKEDPR